VEVKNLHPHPYEIQSFISADKAFDEALRA
jgi:hypothetical protein